MRLNPALILLVIVISLTFFVPSADAAGSSSASVRISGTVLSLPEDHCLMVATTAIPSLTRTYYWTIDRTVDTTNLNLFYGEAGTPLFTTSVDRTTGTDSDRKVDGTIYITNYRAPSVTITSISDVISPSISATVTCPVTFPYTLPAGGTLVCSYTASLPNSDTRTNTVTVMTATTSNSATATVNFAAATINMKNPVIHVTDSNFPPGSGWYSPGVAIGGDATWSYYMSLTCPTDVNAYSSGYATYTHPDTATIQETGDSDSVPVKKDCYAPVVSDPPATSYTRNFAWTITKSATPIYHYLFAGGSEPSTYTVSLHPTITEGSFKVTGPIYVHNPNPSRSMTVSVADTAGPPPYAYPGTTTCTNGNVLTVPAGGTGTCSYSVNLPNKNPGTNTATVYLNGGPFTISEPYTFDHAAITDIRSSVTVTDPNDLSSSRTINGDDPSTWTYTYTKPFTCPTDPTKYSGGVYGSTTVNTATIKETGQYAGRTVVTYCYAPVVVKSAAGTYDLQHDWSIAKFVTPKSQSTTKGKTVSYKWNVKVTNKVTETNFAVKGYIWVANPNSTGQMKVELTDKLNDGTPADIGPCTYGSYDTGTHILTINTYSTAVCPYTATPGTRTGVIKNTATVKLNGLTTTAEAPVAWSPVNVIRGTALLTDSPFFNTYLGDGGSWDVVQYYTCSNNAIDYPSPSFKYTKEFNNAATITASGVPPQTATNSTTVTCSSS